MEEHIDEHRSWRVAGLVTCALQRVVRAKVDPSLSKNTISLLLWPTDTGAMIPTRMISLP